MHGAVAYLIYFPLVLSPIALPHFLLDLPWVLISPIHPLLYLHYCIFMSLAGNKADGVHLILCVCVCWKHFLTNFGGL